MLSFMKMDISEGDLLFADHFTDESLSKNWEVPRGDWKTEKGVLIGRYRENGGALIYTNEQYPGDILMDFYGMLLPPCNNDLNITFRADGWDYERNNVSIGYVGGLNGWWTKQAGLERYPGCKLHAMSGFRAEAGREYHIQAGIIDTLCFIAVDGEVVIALNDPEPITEENCFRVGIGTYCSQIQIRDFKVYRPVVAITNRRYDAQF